MATLGSTNVSTSIAPGGIIPNAWGDAGMIIEVFRIPGGTAGDTCTLTPRQIADIRSVINPANMGHGLSATQANTNVTLTLGTGINTSVTYDVWLIGRRPTT
jgi:hypothetical protein